MACHTRNDEQAALLSWSTRQTQACINAIGHNQTENEEERDHSWKRALIDINVVLLRSAHFPSSTVELDLEEVMVEKSHTAGSWPHLYEPLRGLGQKVADWFAPRSEASAVADTYEIKVELPGVKAENIDVSVHDNSLTVRGEKQFEREETGRDFFFSEREYGAFQRTFRLPPDAAPDKIDAEYKDGVLILKVAKQIPTEPSARKIDIRQG